MASDTLTIGARLRRPASARPARRTATPIYMGLRDEIIALRRKPGEPIIEKQIAKAHGVSRTPVHEAVLRLADEGLIDVIPQLGTFVSRIPLHALPEAGVIRRVLEEATVRSAATLASVSQVTSLRACIEFQRELAPDDHDGFHRADEAFHEMLAEVGGAPGFWTLAHQVKVQIDRCRRLTLPIPGHIAKVIDEHEAIVDAIAVHDEDRAARCLFKHLDGLEAAIDEACHAEPTFFCCLRDGVPSNAARPEG